jgi:hypothetical protein
LQQLDFQAQLFQDVGQLFFHWGYRCPKSNSPDSHLSSEADGLTLLGFTLGLDIILLIGHLRLGQHQSTDEIHCLLMDQLAPCSNHLASGNLLLFEASTAFVRTTALFRKIEPSLIYLSEVASLPVTLLNTSGRR